MGIGTHNVGNVDIHKPSGGRWRVNKLHLENWGDKGTIALSMAQNTQVRFLIPNPKVKGNERFFVKYEVLKGSTVQRSSNVEDQALIDDTIDHDEHLELTTNSNGPQGSNDGRAVTYIAIVQDSASKKHVVDPDITVRDPGSRSSALPTFVSYAVSQLEVEPVGSEGEVEVTARGRIHYGPEGPDAEDEGSPGPVPEAAYFWAVYESQSLIDPIRELPGTTELRFVGTPGTPYWIVLAHDPDATAQLVLPEADRLVVRLVIPTDPGEG